MDFDIDDIPVAAPGHNEDGDDSQQDDDHEFESVDYITQQEAPDLSGNIPNVVDHAPGIGGGAMFCHYLLRFHAYQKGVMFFGYAGKGLDKYEVGTNR
jgi:hypothetical protein